MKLTSWSVDFEHEFLLFYASLLFFFEPVLLDWDLYSIFAVQQV